MQKTYNIDLSLTVCGDNSEQIEQKLNNFISSIRETECLGKDKSISINVVTHFTTVNNGLARISDEDIILVCSSINVTPTLEEIDQIRNRYEDEIIVNRDWNWSEQVEFIVDEIIKNKPYAKS
jgi:hypothetical protein